MILDTLDVFNSSQQYPITKLFRYSLRDPSSHSFLSESHFQLIRLTKALADFKPVAYLTPDYFSSAIPAHTYLSLTYFPRFRQPFEQHWFHDEVLDNQGYVLNGRSKGSRVWPAFGQNGGAHELVITKDHRSDLSNKTMSPLGQLIDGGETDSFHQDNVQNYSPALAKAVAAGIFSALGDLASEDEILAAAKITEQGYVAIKGSVKSKYFTLSVAYKKLQTQVKLKFWAYLWNETKLLRTIYGPLIETYWTHPGWTFENLTVANVETVPSQISPKGPYPFGDISEIVRELLARLTQISNPFFDLYSKPFVLPAVPRRFP